MPHFERNAKFDGYAFPVVNALLDTDPKSFQTAACDFPISLPVTPEIVDVVNGNAPRFGVDIGKILKNEARMLASGDIRNGMRTTRCLSQIVWSYYSTYISDQLRDACDRLLQTGVTSILPVISSSTGGGAGSAFSVLLLQFLSNPDFTANMLLGLPPQLMLAPLMFAVDPFAYARQKKGMQRKKILANAYACRLETDELIKQGVRCQYIFHIGYANEHGTTIRNSHEMGQVLGNSIYSIERNYADLKRDWVDGPDDAAATDNARVANSLRRSDLASDEERKNDDKRQSDKRRPNDQEGR